MSYRTVRKPTLSSIEVFCEYRCLSNERFGAQANKQMICLRLSDSRWQLQAIVPSGTPTNRFDLQLDAAKVGLRAAWRKGGGCIVDRACGSVNYMVIESSTNYRNMTEQELTMPALVGQVISHDCSVCRTNGTYFSGTPFSRTRFASLRGFIRRSYGLGLRFRRRGSTRSGRLPTRWLAIASSNRW